MFVHVLVNESDWVFDQNCRMGNDVVILLPRLTADQHLVLVSDRHIPYPLLVSSDRLARALVEDRDVTKDIFEKLLRRRRVVSRNARCPTQRRPIDGVNVPLRTA
jgi:hypothetical protein